MPAVTGSKPVASTMRILLLALILTACSDIAPPKLRCADVDGPVYSTDSLYMYLEDRDNDGVACE